MRKIGRYLIAYGSAFLLAVLGIVWHAFAPSQTAVIVLAALAVLPLLFLAINLLLAKHYVSRINHAKFADMQSYMLAHRAEAERTSVVLLKKLRGMRHATAIYAIALWLLASCAALLGGMLYSVASWINMLCVLYTGTVFYAILARIRPRSVTELAPNAMILSRSEYPTLYATAERAAATLNCHGELTVLLSLGCNAGIVHDGNRFYLELGAIFLSQLSQEELYAICLHEFSHYSSKNKRAEREMRYGAWLTADREIPSVLLFSNNLFAYCDMRYLFHHMIYQYATSVTVETAADRDMAEHSSPEAAASALLKLYYEDRFRWESGVRDEVPVYAAEKPDPHYLRGYVEKLKQAIETRGADWDALADREILPNNASHPTLKMRLETLGVKHATCVWEDGTSAYRDERQRALDYADQKFCEAQNTYERDRAECYLEPMRRVTEWEAAGMPISAETYADLITDLKQLGRHEEAEALCDRVMRELDVNSSPHAYFIKGYALLHRYDEAGIALVYHALENNHNYLEEGLQVIGEFCCITGREAELLEYRERARELAQKERDEYSETGVLSKHDRLSAEHMPDGMLEEILAYIRSVDCDLIQSIYLVRKTISESFFTSAFVIRFYGGTDQQRDEIMHKIFRYLDTYPVDWQFSLFDYFECRDIHFDKIEGSLVYRKADHNET